MVRLGIVANPTVKTLIMRNCSLVNISKKVFETAVSLADLDVSMNNLTEFPALQLGNGYCQVNFSDNSIRCSCRMK